MRVYRSQFKEVLLLAEINVVTIYPPGVLHLI